jgi:TM2 domain-containing membrane protein YozV
MSQPHDPVPPTTPMDAPTAASPDQRLGQPAPGWWLASDGQWYPPQTQPAYAQPGAVQPYGQPGYGQPAYVDPRAKSRVVAGVLQLAVGGLGIGRFYLGYTGIGIAQIAVTFLTCGFGVIWTIIDGIMILTGKVPTDANGIPLKD